MKYFIIDLVLILLSLNQSFSQNQYWQQRVEYKININMDVENNQFEGRQILRYTNNSLDTLTKVFYHLYFNAFQPGSMMDVRSRTIVDMDKKIGDRIFKLKEDEQGWHKITSLTQDGEPLDYEVIGTLLEVTLTKPILPGTVSLFQMEFDSQVPLQIRRSGRDNKEGIRYSMSQWYPKMAEYDQTGWQAHPYVAREFYGPWGDFDVTIVMDKSYVIGATGDLQNPEEIGYGYDKPKSKGKSGIDGKLIWKFFAKNVGDFVWAADPDYKHDIVKSESNAPDMHFIYQKDTSYHSWQELKLYGGQIFNFLETKFGSYPYDDYSIIQGGDGGMEYPMATLVTGNRTFRSLLAVSIHEIAHSWLPLLTGTNESYLYWLDEGFASFATSIAMDEILPQKKKENPFESRYKSYYSL
ncbi:MAG: M1 family metallopeptidase, partial [Cyclobacteriaceae bacterium]|nr:M1 family metallopeptidase [Cyclobacteriaceae bacterium]